MLLWGSPPPPSFEAALQAFLGLASREDHPDWISSDDYEVMRACAVYTLMRTHNAVRHGLTALAATRAFRGYAFELIRGSTIPRFANAGTTPLGDLPGSGSPGVRGTSLISCFGRPQWLPSCFSPRILPSPLLVPPFFPSPTPLLAGCCWLCLLEHMLGGGWPLAGWNSDRLRAGRSGPSFLSGWPAPFCAASGRLRSLLEWLRVLWDPRLWLGRLPCCSGSGPLARRSSFLRPRLEC